MGIDIERHNDYEAELDDYLGRPGKDEYHPSDTRIPLWSGNFSPHSLAALASQTVRSVEPRSWREAVASVDAKQWQAAAHDEMTSLIKASVLPSPSLSCPRSSCFQQMGLQGQKAIRWVD